MKSVGLNMGPGATVGSWLSKKDLKLQELVDLKQFVGPQVIILNGLIENFD